MDRKTIEGLGEIGNDMYDILIRNTALLTPNMTVDSGRDIAISSGIHSGNRSRSYGQCKRNDRWKKQTFHAWIGRWAYSPDTAIPPRQGIGFAAADLDKGHAAF